MASKKKEPQVELPCLAVADRVQVLKDIVRKKYNESEGVEIDEDLFDKLMQPYYPAMEQFFADVARIEHKVAQLKCDVVKDKKETKIVFTAVDAEDPNKSTPYEYIATPDYEE